MILFELYRTEKHPAYQSLSIDNLERQYDFLRSIIRVAVEIQRPMISSAIVKALNSHAIACLHVNAGQYRPGAVTVGKHEPAHHYRVPDLMEDFINEVNFSWDRADAINVATYALWKLCYIHPFINGNGRTARALAYYVICVKAGGILPGKITLPELIRRDHDEYVKLLQAADAAFEAGDPKFLVALHAFIARLIQEQLDSAAPAAPGAEN